jgi:hypothetical protein
LFPAADLALLPPSLTDISIAVEYPTGGASADINISQLSRLQVMLLALNKRSWMSTQSQLPDSLKFFTLAGGAGAVPGLGKLEYLHVNLPGDCLPLLGRLPQLPALQQVSQECGPGLPV